MPQWLTEGPFTNPPAGTVLAQTDVSGAIDMKIVCVANVGAVLRLEWRDATNTSNIRSQFLGVPPNDTTVLDFINDIEIAPNERIRLVTVGAIVGSIQCSFMRAGA